MSTDTLIRQRMRFNNLYLSQAKQERLNSISSKYDFINNALYEDIFVYKMSYFYSLYLYVKKEKSKFFFLKYINF